MNHASRVYVFESSQDLVEKVLDELFFERSGGQQSVEIGSEELSDEVEVFERRYEDVAEANDLGGYSV